MRRGLATALVLLGLTACAGAPKKTDSPPTDAASSGQRPTQPPKKSPYAPAQEDPSKRGHYTAGGLYAPHIADAAPDEVVDVSLIPEPAVIAEPRSRYGNRATYSVLGKNYHVLDDAAGYVEQGRASYYGTKFHGRRTSNMEVYDMYAFSAAHKSLPLPSFALVTNLDNNKSVVVRVNDRGPFHEGRIIDLSYAAATKLDILRAGTGRVEVRALAPDDDIAALAPDRGGAGRPAAAAAAGATVPAPSSMDRLVATLPEGGAGAAVLPPGVRIATGKPTRLNAAASSAAPDRRFDTSQDGRTMTAAEFDAWMTQRRAVAPGTAHRRHLQQVAADATAAEAATAVQAPAAAGDAITLQVASFTARDNADRALALLRGAGIGEASLQDATANGQRVWRLRVGPLTASAAPSLATRIAGLGFGTPRPVRE